MVAREWRDAVTVALAALPDYFMHQRWYPAKDAAAPSVTLVALLPLAAPGMTASGLTASVAIWRAKPPGRNAVHLFLPLAVLAQGRLAPSNPAVIGVLAQDAILADAFAVDEFVRAFVDLMVLPQATPADLQSGRTDELTRAGLDLGGEWAVRRGSAEQSNTSIRIGDGAILKVIRKLEHGIHPELEMGRFLTEQAHFAAIPALLAWIDHDGSTLAILQSFVPNEGDGWNWILERLRAGGIEQRARALRWIRTLGERTAELHLALANETSDPSFSPAPAAAADWQRWRGDVEAMAARVLDGLKNKHGLDARTQRIADLFEKRGAALPQVLSRLLGSAPTLAKTRHHGDYHLGQVLVRGDDVAIVDFEGEPLRSLPERRAKHIPLRDVAGMLRSFGYAAAVAEHDLPGSMTSPQRDAAVADLRQWAADASAVYLDGYFKVAESRLGASLDEAKRLVQFFTIEKALYEVLYELANRPTWISIPLSSVLALFDQPVARMHRLPQGAELEPKGGVRFRLWAPACRVRLALYSESGAEELLPMEATGDGFQELTVASAGAGTRYHYVLPDGTRVPDPASRFQPDDVHGSSEVIDPRAYEWRDAAWCGRPWHEAVVYELHVGTFTPEGTFRAAIARLEHLVSLGVTAIEIMPVADFPGARNWGYDGVLLFAPDSSYGRPEDLKALIDAAHTRGLMVLLDVVYNHFGPDGNYLPVYAPAFFTDRHKTPWGAAVNYDGPHSRPVREFVIHNALYWIEEYNLDGLRLDAVHAILDDGPRHVLDELAERVRAARGPQRPVHLVLENEENQSRRLARDAGGKPLHFTAQWNDDLHHVLHVAATGEDTGYYAEYLADTDKLGRALAEGFAFQGEMMEFRGAPRGEPSAHLPPSAFVAFIQNHDQIGNRAFGERLTAIAPSEAVRAAAAMYLLLPQVPMLFMGEEWAAAQPFPFFCDFGGELAEAVRKGRREEFAKFPEFQDESKRARIPDPQAESTFASAKLRWGDLRDPAHAAWHSFYRRLLAARREALLPLLPLIGGDAAHYEILGAGALIVRWRLAEDGAELVLAANLSAHRVTGLPAEPGRVLWQEGPAGEQGAFGPWFVRWSHRAAP